MDKFYVQSGNLRSVVQAESHRKAALWAVHRVMRQFLPIDGADDDRDDRSSVAQEHPKVALASAVRVSRCGFDRADASELPTMEVVSEWNQMVQTLARLEKMLYHAA